MNFNTKLLHGKSAGTYSHGSTLPAVIQSNAYQYDSFEQLERVFNHKAMGYAYSRIGNPTVSAFEQRICELEGGMSAAAVSSGMAAVTLSLLNILTAGDEIIAASDLYGGTIDLFGDLEKFGIHTKFVDNMIPEQIEPLINDHTRCIFGEVISNPALHVMDIPAVAELAHAHHIPLIADNTTATPFLVNPLPLGADIVVHSSSKYISGSGNSISGVIIDGGHFDWDPDRFPALKSFKKYGKLAYITRLRTDLLENFGCCLAPANAFLNVLGLETLGLRMERICKNADTLAKALESEDVQVNYPLLSFPSLCEEQLRGMGGGILTFRAGSGKKAAAILNSLNYAAIASNIGDVRTLVICPATTIFMKNSEEHRRKAGVYEDTVRVSVGIEDAGDLTEDFLSAIHSAV